MYLICSFNLLPYFFCLFVIIRSAFLLLLCFFFPVTQNTLWKHHLKWQHTTLSLGYIIVYVNLPYFSKFNKNLRQKKAPQNLKILTSTIFSCKFRYLVNEQLSSNYFHFLVIFCVSPTIVSSFSKPVSTENYSGDMIMYSFCFLCAKLRRIPR